MEQISEKLGEISFRAAAFWRLLYNVFTMTKNKREVFLPEFPSAEPNWDDIEDVNRMLYSMIIDMNGGTNARATFLTNDAHLLASAVLKVVRAFEDAPEIHLKIMTCWMGSVILCEINDRIAERVDEVRNLSKQFYELSKKTKGVDVVPNASLRVDGPNDWLTFSVRFN